MTNDKLRREVAEACGWAVVQGDDTYWHVYHNGQEMKRNHPDWKFRAEYSAWLVVPDFPNDIGACIVELDRTGMSWQLVRLPTEQSMWVAEGVELDESKRYRCVIGRPLSDVGLGPVIAYGATAAEAAYRALLAWHKRGVR